MKLTCWSCNRATELTEVFKDELGYHRICPECGASHNIEIEDVIEFQKEKARKELKT